MKYLKIVVLLVVLSVAAIPARAQVQVVDNQFYGVQEDWDYYSALPDGSFEAGNWFINSLPDRFNWHRCNPDLNPLDGDCVAFLGGVQVDLVAYLISDMFVVPENAMAVGVRMCYRITTCETNDNIDDWAMLGLYSDSEHYCNIRMYTEFDAYPGWRCTQALIDENLTSPTLPWPGADNGCTLCDSDKCSAADLRGRELWLYIGSAFHPNHPGEPTQTDMLFDFGDVIIWTLPEEDTHKLYLPAIFF